jgi:hypothetical protein
MNDELERMWKEAVVAYPGICLERHKDTINLSHDSRFACRDLNTGPPKYEVVVQPFH